VKLRSAADPMVDLTTTTEADGVHIRAKVFDLVGVAGAGSSGLNGTQTPPRVTGT